MGPIGGGGWSGAGVFPAPLLVEGGVPPYPGTKSYPTAPTKPWPSLIAQASQPSLITYRLYELRIMVIVRSWEGQSPGLLPLIGPLTVYLCC